MRKIVYFLLMFLLFSTTVMSQALRKFNVVSFEEKPFDRVIHDSNSDLSDGNGSLFAILKVTSDEENDDLCAYSFDFGLCEGRFLKCENGELWLCVQRNAMHVTISRPGYSTVKHEFSTTVQPGRVYAMALSVAPRVIKKRMVLFQVSPADSEALVTYKAEGETGDYKPFGNATVDEDGYLAKNLELGTYVYRITSNNYYVSEGYIYLDDQSETHVEQVNLRSKYRKVVFEISPFDSKAIITYKATDDDGEYQPLGRIDDNGRLEKSMLHGTYQYKVSSGNYYPNEGGFVLDEVQGEYIKKVVLKPNFGTLSLTAEPGVDIYIDDEKKGVNSWIGNLSPGFYNIECRKDKHRSTIESVEIEEGKTKNVVLKAPEPIIGSLSLMSKPMNAIITIDGKDVGVTPKNIFDLLIGTHEIQLSKSGYKTESKTIEIKENENTECCIELTKPEVVATASYRGHEYVDLGLPSGVMWATCNVGAEKPEEYGGYYGYFGIKSYEHYCGGGFDWNDAVAAMWGGEWRTPSEIDLMELVEKCDWQWTAINGVSGYKITGVNGNFIFLPAAGEYNDDGSSIGRGEEGTYWLTEYYRMDCAFAFGFSKNGIGSFQEGTAWYKNGISSFLEYVCDKNSVRLVFGKTGYNITTESGTINGHGYVDLGLPSGLLWATCNIGASSSRETGAVYAWGETETKSLYTKENSKTYGKNIGDISGNPLYDVARAKWGGNWRLPTKQDFEELLENCELSMVASGWIFTGKNGNRILMKRYSDYMSSTPDDSECMYILRFFGYGPNVEVDYRCNGNGVRPVCKSQRE